MSVPRQVGDDYEEFQNLKCDGWCEIESMCCSAALAKRAGVTKKQLASLPDEHPVWDTCAHYMAALCANLVLTVSVERIVLGGGVMLRRTLFPRIRSKMQTMLNGYISVDAIQQPRQLDALIVPSDHGNDAGIMGALGLAQHALEQRSSPAGAGGGGNGGARSLDGAALAAGAAIGAALALFAVQFLKGTGGGKR